MRFRKLLALAALAVAGAACDGGVRDLAGPAGPQFHHGDTLAVAISAPDGVGYATSVTATASLIRGSGSWRYTWSLRRCTGSTSTCAPSWSQIADGQDLTQVTASVGADDAWVEFKVEVKDIYDHVLVSDTHLTQGPRVDVSISGASVVTAPGDAEYTASVSTTGSWTYTWEQNVDGQGWTQLYSSDTSTVLLCIGPIDGIPIGGPSGPHRTYDIDLRVTASDGLRSGTASTSISVQLPTYDHYPCSAGW